MINTLILGFSGPAGSGKDEAARVALEVFEASGIPAQQYSFAFPLKEVAKFVFDMTDEEINDRELKEQEGRNTYGMTNRRVMQLLGTESFRDIFNENIWIDVAERLIQKAGTEICVISDVRFENEAQWVKENGILVHIDPSGREDFVTTSETHSSEAGYETEPTHVVENLGTLEEYQNQIATLVHSNVIPVYKNIAERVAAMMVEMNEAVQSIKAEALADE